MTPAPDIYWVFSLTAILKLLSGPSKEKIPRLPTKEEVCYVWSLHLPCNEAILTAKHRGQDESLKLGHTKASINGEDSASSDLQQDVACQEAATHIHGMN